MTGAPTGLRELLERRLGAAEADRLLALASPDDAPPLLVRGVPVELTPPAPGAAPPVLR